MLLPKEDSEERAIRRFLEYYNQTNGTSYGVNECEWLDRRPRIGKKQQGPMPDCLCVDSVSGTEMVIERTRLTGERDLRLSQGAEKFLAGVRDRLTCKLPGVFPLYEIENGKYKMNLNLPKLKPVADYIKLQGRFRHLSEDVLNKIQQRTEAEYLKLQQRAAADASPSASVCI